MFVRTTLVLGPLGLCPSFPPSRPPANWCSLGLGGGGPGCGATFVRLLTDYVVWTVRGGASTPLTLSAWEEGAA